MPNKAPAPTRGDELTMLDVERVAELLACSARHVRRLADRGALPRPRKLGHLTRWAAADLADWMNREGGSNG